MRVWVEYREKKVRGHPTGAPCREDHREQLLSGIWEEQLPGKGHSQEGLCPTRRTQTTQHCLGLSVHTLKWKGKEWVHRKQPAWQLALSELANR